MPVQPYSGRAGGSGSIPTFASPQLISDAADKAVQKHQESETARLRQEAITYGLQTGTVL